MSLDNTDFIKLLNQGDIPPLVNIGCGENISIAELSKMIAEVIGFKEKLVFDTSKPDGRSRKLLDVSRIYATGRSPAQLLKSGLRLAYNDLKMRY